VIITSRSPSWSGVAATIALDVFTRAESLDLLRAEIPAIGGREAEQIAAALGDLPLALAQAIGVMTTDAVPPDEYLHLIDTSIARLARTGKPAGYPSSLAASVGVALDRLDSEDRAAGQLMRISAWLGPEPIPVWLLATSARTLPAPLREIAADGLGLRQAIGLAARYGMIRSSGDSFTLHRLTQAIIRADHTPPGEYGRNLIEAVLIAAQPGNPGDPGSWPRWGEILPHLLATDPATTDNTDVMWLAGSAVWHLRERGAYGEALTIAQTLHKAWGRRHGPDHRNVLDMAYNVASILEDVRDYPAARVLLEDTLARRRRLLGDDAPGTLDAAAVLALVYMRTGAYQQARALGEDTLERQRRILGDDDPSTLGSANNVAVNLRALGMHERARALDDDTLARKRRVLGDDHPSTLNTANGLAIDLRELGMHEQARILDEDALVRSRRVLGDDHPSTLISANNLAVDLSALGLHAQARALDEDTLARRRRVLGDDHLDTLSSGNNLARDLRALGMHVEARALDEDVLARRRRAKGDEHPDPEPA
jgi:hypothetical protein